MIFNNKKFSSYHPWNAKQMGETYGTSELNEIISVKDYLGSSPMMDDFLIGYAKGRRVAQERKNKANSNKKEGQLMNDLMKKTNNLK